MKYNLIMNREGLYEAVMLGGASVIRRLDEALEKCPNKHWSDMIVEMRKNVGKSLLNISDNIDNWGADELKTVTEYLSSMYKKIDSLSWLS